MGKDLAETNDHAARVFNQANEILGFDLAGVCFEGPAEKLEATDLQQPSILVTSLALWAALTEGGSRDLPTEALAGLSLGEYTALHVAGALSFEDALLLVHKRGQYMQDAARAVSSGMVSLLGLSADEVADLCRRAAQGAVLGPANYNCPGQIVVSGETSACQRVIQIIEAEGRGKAVMLRVAGAFHSELMRPAAEKLNVELQHTAFGLPRAAVISNVDARPHSDAEGIRQALYHQVCSPVRWQESIERLIADGVEQFVEVGPGRVLTGLMRKIDRRKTAVNIGTAQALTEFCSA
jgi:[acyl-carrier-protein] S-malonyltransferase